MSGASVIRLVIRPGIAANPPKDGALPNDIGGALASKASTPGIDGAPGIDGKPSDDIDRVGIDGTPANSSPILSCKRVSFGAARSA